MTGGRYFMAIVGLVAISLPAWTFAGQVEIGMCTCHCSPWRLGRFVVLDNQNQQSGTAAKDDIVLSSHDDSFDGDGHEEKFSYKYKNIGSKTIKVAVTVKAQHHGYYESNPRPEPFRTETFSFTLGAGEEHEVSGNWKIEKPSNEGDPEMEYADDDHPDLLQATYSDGK